MLGLLGFVIEASGAIAGIRGLSNASADANTGHKANFYDGCMILTAVWALMRLVQQTTTFFRWARSSPYW